MEKATAGRKAAAQGSRRKAYKERWGKGAKKRTGGEPQLPWNSGHADTVRPVTGAMNSQVEHNIKGRKEASVTHSSPSPSKSWKRRPPGALRVQETRDRHPRPSRRPNENECGAGIAASVEATN